MLSLQDLIANDSVVYLYSRPKTELLRLCKKVGNGLQFIEGIICSISKVAVSGYLFMSEADSYKLAIYG
jgi:hypothetical protein